MLYIEIIAALVPAIVLLVWIYRKDKLEHEPWGLIGLCFLFGIISVVPAVILEELIDIPFTALTGGDSVLYYLLENFIGVALVEEACKLGATRRAWKKPAFNCSFDGVVYGIAAALGFAALENVLYVVSSDDALVVALERALVSVPGHMCFGVFIGLYLGRAKELMVAGKPYKGAIAQGLVIASIAHGIFDFLLTVELVIPWLIFVVVMYIVVFRQVNAAQKADRKFLG